MEQDKESINHLHGTEQRKENETKEESLRDVWDNIKRININIIGVQEGEDRKKRSEKIFEDKIARNFLNIEKEMVTQIQWGQSPRHYKPNEEYTEIQGS